MICTEHLTAGEYDRTVIYVQKNSYPAYSARFSYRHTQIKRRTHIPPGVWLALEVNHKITGNKDHMRHYNIIEFSPLKTMQDHSWKDTEYQLFFFSENFKQRNFYNPYVTYHHDVCIWCTPARKPAQALR